MTEAHSSQFDGIQQELRVLCAQASNPTCDPVRVGKQDKWNIRTQKNIGLLNQELKDLKDRLLRCVCIYIDIDIDIYIDIYIHIYLALNNPSLTE